MNPIVRRLLTASPFCAGAALLLTAWALIHEGDYLAKYGATRLIFDTAAHLVFQPPADAANFHTWPFAAARVCVVLFALTTSVGLVLAASRSARDAWLRGSFWMQRIVLKKRPSIVIGLGAVLGPLVEHLCARGPVFAIDVTSEGLHVDTAREHGAFVIAGDATDATVTARADVSNARTVFIATGDDLRNLTIAASLSGAAAPGRTRLPRDPLDIYVHTSDTAGWLARHGHFPPRGRTHGVAIVPFSTADLIARELFFAPLRGLAVSGGTVPRADEVFHLFVFGFGAVGQAAARHVSRFAHFSSRLRPRLTIYADGAALEHARGHFLERHPAFAPPDLDLASPSFLRIGDGWDVRPGRPAARDYQRGALEVCTDGGGTRSVRPVEYAVNAEFRPLPGIESGPLVDEIAARLWPASGPPVRAGAVVCFDQSRQNLEMACRLRLALARRLLDDAPAHRSRPVLPIAVHVTGDSSFVDLLEDQQEDGLAQMFPFRIVGRSKDVASLDAITNGPWRASAGEIRDAYRILAGQRAFEHPDFDDSNLDAALHAEAVKFPALGIVFRQNADPSGPSPMHAAPLLASLLRAAPAEARRLLASGHGEAGDMPVEAVCQLHRDLNERGQDLDLAAEMEHNRWMGERLTKGWSFGARSDLRRQRPGFVPWCDLTESDRDIDRSQLARLILGRGLSGTYAHVTHARPAAPVRSGHAL